MICWLLHAACRPCMCFCVCRSGMCAHRNEPWKIDWLSSTYVMALKTTRSNARTQACVNKHMMKNMGFDVTWSEVIIFAHPLHPRLKSELFLLEDPSYRNKRA